MEKQTAYCKYCKRNVPVTHFIPKKHLVWIVAGLFTPVLINIIVDLIRDIMRGRAGGGPLSDNFVTDLFFVLLLLSPILFIVRIPSNGFYCEKCGKFIGPKSEAKDRCVYCDAKLEPGVVFCPKCGRKYRQVKDSATCKKCKTENSLDATYCVKCGAKLPVSSKKALKQSERSKAGNSQKTYYGWQDWE